MFHDSENGTLRAMTSQASFANIASRTVEIDLTHHASANQTLIVSVRHHACEFMSRNSREPVVSALEFQIRVADSGKHHADSCESTRPLRRGRLDHINLACFEVNGLHAVFDVKPDATRLPAILAAAELALTSCSSIAAGWAITPLLLRTRFIHNQRTSHQCAAVAGLHCLICQSIVANLDKSKTPRLTAEAVAKDIHTINLHPGFGEERL
jgi:hypothetical protein